MSRFCFKDKSLELGQKTYVMGILNITPDSFSDGGQNLSLEKAVNTAVFMEAKGVDIIDIGGQSTRPGHTEVSAEEEWSRLEMVLHQILKQVYTPISVDTFYPEVAEKALKLGCHIINDVSGTVNPKMAELVKKHSAGWVVMHNNPIEDNNFELRLHKELVALREKAIRLGVKCDNICLDPGVGFGKTPEQNRLIIKGTEKIKVHNTAYLLGASRKRVIGEAVGEDTPFNERDFGTVAAHTVGALGGADIIRVHNIEAGIQTVKMVDSLR